MMFYKRFYNICTDSSSQTLHSTIARIRLEKKNNPLDHER